MLWVIVIREIVHPWCYICRYTMHVKKGLLIWNKQTELPTPVCHYVKVQGYRYMPYRLMVCVCKTSIGVLTNKSRPRKLKLKLPKMGVPLSWLVEIKVCDMRSNVWYFSANFFFKNWKMIRPRTILQLVITNIKVDLQSSN